MAKVEKKLYIVSLKYKSWRKRLYLEGDDNDYTKEQLKKAFVALNEIGDKSKDWLEFLNKAIETFKKFGFTRTHH